ncbi:SUN domain-containing protein 3 [Musca vetustissima]|uniref:SUN domain-containing protein 3 n=1 Tax=Musca vetustissima TaxID=27455 RepID=UPI002AB6005D|nr:SUN domain-containing protein 3 [Musca vetustissima]
MIQLNRYRICVFYIITTMLISCFVYTLISNNIQNAQELKRLREEIDEIAHLVLHNSINGRESPYHLSDTIDAMIKKRLSGIWDDLFHLKKMLKMDQESKEIKDSEESHEPAVTKVVERVNYAADELGAKILFLMAEPICGTNFLQSWLGMEFTCNPPVHMLRTSMKPGNCFGFRGQQAEVTIQLSHEIILDQILVEHIPKYQSPTENTTSAPKDFEIIGIYEDFHEFSLGKYRFLNNPERPRQYFTVITNDRVGFLRFKFLSNHGHPNYTCVYRIAVYGRL